MTCGDLYLSSGVTDLDFVPVSSDIPESLILATDLGFEGSGLGSGVSSIISAEESRSGTGLLFADLLKKKLDAMWHELLILSLAPYTLREISEKGEHKFKLDTAMIPLCNELE